MCYSYISNNKKTKEKKQVSRKTPHSYSIPPSSALLLQPPRVLPSLSTSGERKLAADGPLSPMTSRQKLLRLSQMFPAIDRDVVGMVLDQCQGDIEVSVAALSDMNNSSVSMATASRTVTATETQQETEIESQTADLTIEDGNFALSYQRMQQLSSLQQQRINDLETQVAGLRALAMLNPAFLDSVNASGEGLAEVILTDVGTSQPIESIINPSAEADISATAPVVTPTPSSRKSNHFTPAVVSLDMFELFVVVGVSVDANFPDDLPLAKNGKPISTGKEARMKPEILFSFPQGKTVNGVLDLPYFCFPSGVPARNVGWGVDSVDNASFAGDLRALREESYVFRLMSQSGVLFGVCVAAWERLNESPSFLGYPAHGDAAASSRRSSNSGPQLFAQRCYCVLSCHPFMNTHFHFLYSVLTEERLFQSRRFSESLDNCMELLSIRPISPSADSPLIELVDNERGTLSPVSGAEVPPPYILSVKELAAGLGKKAHPVVILLEGFRKTPVPGPGSEVWIDLGPSVPTLHIRRPKLSDDGVLLAYWSLITLSRNLSLRNVLHLTGCALLEKQIIVVAENLGVLSAACFAVMSLCRPLEWVGMLVPILPLKMLAFVDAPVPYIVGVQASPPAVPGRESIHVLLEKDEIRAPPKSYFRMPKYDSLFDALNPVYRKLQGMMHDTRDATIGISDSQIQAVDEFLGILASYYEWFLESSLIYERLLNNPFFVSRGRQRGSLVTSPIVTQSSSASVTSPGVVTRTSVSSMPFSPSDTALDMISNEDSSFMQIFLRTQMWHLFVQQRQRSKPISAEKRSKLL